MTDLTMFTNDFSSFFGEYLKIDVCPLFKFLEADCSKY